MNIKQLLESVTGLGSNAQVVIRDNAGAIFEVESFDTRPNRDGAGPMELVVVIGGNAENSHGARQEAGISPPSTQDVLNNQSGNSFAANGSPQGIGATPTTSASDVAPAKDTGLKGPNEVPTQGSDGKPSNAGTSGTEPTPAKLESDQLKNPAPMGVGESPAGQAKTK